MPKPFHQTHLRDLAALNASELCSPHTPKRGRAGTPGVDTPAASCANGSEHTSIVTTVAPVHPAFPHAVCSGLLRALPGECPRACHRRIRVTLPSVEGESTVRTPQDHTTWAGATHRSQKRLPVPASDAAAWSVSPRFIPSRFSGLERTLCTRSAPPPGLRALGIRLQPDAAAPPHPASRFGRSRYAPRVRRDECAYNPTRNIVKDMFSFVVPAKAGTQ